ncbi:hypothetical protein KSP40_PGU012975 [Platanthera guangdongensis]|uniref:Uncharacterized protein n=1 Tax=Platanthera guangdongensis TaxID=2320717 RepID=A0ABR2MBH0_9ASPA
MSEIQLPTSSHRPTHRCTIIHELLNFMDAYSSYNRIRMNPVDKEHTTFRIYERYIIIR